MNDSAYIIESIRVGSCIKVSAIDPETSTEVSISAPLTSSEKERMEIAVQKLEYVLKRQKQQPR